jgi:hypothetical protein
VDDVTWTQVETEVRNHDAQHLHVYARLCVRSSVDGDCGVRDLSGPTGGPTGCTVLALYRGSEHRG